MYILYSDEPINMYSFCFPSSSKLSSFLKPHGNWKILILLQVGKLSTMQLKTNRSLVSVSFSPPKSYTLTLVSLPWLSQFAEWPCSWDIKDVCLLLESHIEVETLISGFFLYLSKGSLHSKALSHRSRSWLHADHQYANWISWNWKVDSWHSETTQSVRGLCMGWWQTI